MPKRRKSPEKLVIISCRAPRSLATRLGRLADRARRTQSSYLRLLLEDVVTAQEKQPDAKAL